GDGGPPADGGGGAQKSANPQPKVTDCGGTVATPATGICAGTAPGASGKVFRGTVLCPEGGLPKGQGLIDDARSVLCVGGGGPPDPAYAAASVVSCPDGVISPGLINPHDHISYANNGPIGHGTERYEHRHDWRTGAHGHTKITTKSGASQIVQTFAELR